MPRRVLVATSFVLLCAATAAVGAAGPWGAPVSLSGTSDAQIGSGVATPQVAVNGGGAAVAVWTIDSGRREVVQAASQPSAGAAWSRPVSLGTPIAEGIEPRVQVALNDAGDAVAVWQAVATAGRSRTYTVSVATRTPDGHWSAPQTLSSGSANASNPDVAIDSGGDATAVWQSASSQQVGVRWHVRAATQPAGGTWSTPAELATVTRSSGDPPLVGYDAAGNATALWSRPNEDAKGTQHGFVIESATMARGGVWSAGVVVATALRDFSAPKARFALDAGGDAIAVWEAISVRGQYQIVGATRIGFAGSWTPIAAPLSDAGRNAHDPQVAIGASGVFAAAWRRSNGRHYVAQAATGPLAGGRPAPATLSGAGLDENAVDVAVDASGRAYAVWAARSHGGASAVRGAISAPAWSAGAAIGSADRDGFDLAVAAGPSGRAVAVWLRSGSGGATIQSAALR
jgi:hypothetical protein